MYNPLSHSFIYSFIHLWCLYILEGEPNPPSQPDDEEPEWSDVLSNHQRRPHPVQNNTSNSSATDQGGIGKSNVSDSMANDTNFSSVSKPETVPSNLENIADTNKTNANTTIDSSDKNNATLDGHAEISSTTPASLTSRQTSTESPNAADQRLQGTGNNTLQNDTTDGSM